MWKTKTVVDAKFNRKGSNNSIDVFLPSGGKLLSLFDGIIGYGARGLSEIEIEQVISILKQKKDKMGVRGCPQVFEDMLSDLCDVHVKRSATSIQRGNKKTKTSTRFRQGRERLEDLLKQHHAYKEVHITSITIGLNRHNIITMAVNSDSVLDLVYSVEGEEDK